MFNKAQVTVPAILLVSSIATLFAQSPDPSPTPESQREILHKALWENNFRFQGTIKDSNGNALDNVTLYVKEFIPEGWEGRHRDTESIIPSDYQWDSEGVAIVSLKFFKEGYYSEEYDVNIMEGLPSDLQPGTDRFLLERDIVLTSYPSSFPEMKVSSLGRFFNEPAQPELDVFRFPNEESKRTLFGQNWQLEDDELSRMATIGAPYLVMEFEADPTKIAITDQGLAGIGYCTPDQHRVLLRIKGLEDVNEEYWGVDDVEDGIFLAYPSVPAEFEAMSKMVEAPSSGYTNVFEIPEVNLNECENAGLYSYFYINIGARYGKGALIAINHFTRDAGMPPVKVGGTFKIFMNPEFDDRNVATEDGWDFP